MRISLPRHARFASLSMLPLLAAAAGAQRPAAFSTIGVEVAGLRGAREERLHETWEQGGGFGVEVSTPLPLGEAGLGVAQLPFRARTADQPDFRARLLTARWGLAGRLAGPLSIRASVIGGNFLMRFDDGPWAVGGLSTESELFLGARGSLDLVVRGVGVTAGIEYDRVLTRVPIGLVTLRAGGRVVTRTPAWLRGVLE
jgi:hypothetical protein